MDQFMRMNGGNIDKIKPNLKIIKLLGI